MRKILPLLLLALLLTSCMQVNTMYNARKYFNAAQARPLNANGRPNNQAVEEYTKAIKKCGIILSNSKRDSRTDDALFLMARALYYKGNSAFQAKDQFESLIKGFPDSPFFGEAHIYLAKVLRDINLKDESNKALQDFVLDPQHKKLHPRALLTLADFNIKDKDYLRAQFWLGKIITEYPKSDEYREAFFLYGQNYFTQKDYRAALGEFEKIAKDRNIPQQMKLDARYYVALNQFLLGEYDQSAKTLRKLLKDEIRPDKLSQVRVLQARLLLASGDTEKGLAEIEDISKVYLRTLSSAEAQYYLGEYYFYEVRDLEKAGTAYSKVRTEFLNSELAEPGQEKATAINQLKTKIILNPETNLQQYVDYLVTAAENYFNVFSMPDSALVMYQRLIDSRDLLVALRDTVAVELDTQQGVVDSLTIFLEALPQPVINDSIEAPADSLENILEETDLLPDSLAILDKDNESFPDSLDFPEPAEDIEAEPDSLDIPEPILPEEKPAEPDSLDIPELIIPGEKPAEPDSLNIPEPILPEEKPTEPDSLNIPEPILPEEKPAEPDSLDIPELVIPGEKPEEPDSLDIPELVIPGEKPAEPDSLDIPELIIPDESPAVPDSLQLPEPEQKQEEIPAGSLDFPEVKLSTEEPVIPDSLKLQEIGLDQLDTQTLTDSLDIVKVEDTIPAESDSLATPNLPENQQPKDLAAQRLAVQKQLTAAETELKKVQTRVLALNGLMQRYDRELVPLALFSQATIHNRRGTARESMESIYAGMLSQFPDNKYTNALEDMLAGEEVRLIDPEEEAQELLLDRALGLAESEPDSMRVILEELSASEYPPISLRAYFRLGWHYSFEVADTTAAKPYLAKVLELDRNGEYGSLTTRFFDGKKFKLPKPEIPVDSLTVSDSLAVAADSTAFADSLNVSDTEEEPEQKPEPEPEIEEEESPPEAPLDIDLPQEPKPDETLPELTSPDETAPETPLSEEDLPPKDGDGSPPPNPDGLTD